MFSTVSSWFVGIKPDDEGAEVIGSQESASNKENKNSSSSITSNTESESSSQENKVEGEQSEDGKDIQAQLDEMSAKAVNTAKEWGAYLFSYGKTATAQVAKAAIQLKDVVTEGTMLGEFGKEQDKFVSEKKQKQKLADAAVPPWVGYNEEETMKKQILALSMEKRNFLRNPPAGVQFAFDYNAAYPVAKAVLQEDENLQKMRFDLVPKQVTEEHFWRNYFYRVSLIKQSAQLSSLAQHAGERVESKPENLEKRSLEVDIPPVATTHREDDQLSPVEHEFVSDMIPETQLSDEEMKQMQMQGKSTTSQQQKATKEIADWEEELQQELQEYEVVMEGNGGPVSDVDLENELLRQIEEEQEQNEAVDLSTA